MSHIVNPGNGGGGVGTVTSIGGGIGWTPTPDPLIGVGVGDLDLGSLTPETTLALDDLMAFVDVSVGIGPGAQRVVELADLAVFLGTTLNPLLDHGLLGGLGDDDHTDYVRKTGRAGTANDIILSLTVSGTIYGGITQGNNLILGATNAV